MGICKTRKKSIAVAMSAVIGVSALPLYTSADLVLTFQDNTNPSAPPLPFSHQGSSTLAFPASTEFRVVTPLYGTATNNGFKDAIFGGESWTFDNNSELTAVANTDPNPGATQSAPITAGVAGFTICTGFDSCDTLHRSASFLQASNFFNFLAPTAGSVPGNTYGPGKATLDLTSNTLSIDYPVTQAQWADGNYIIGNDPNRGCPPATRGDKFVKGQGPGTPFSSDLTVTSAPGASTITFDFRLFGEQVMSSDEVTVAGFCNNAVQWELPGTGAVDNQNPVANNDGSMGSPINVLTDTPTNIDVVSNDTDPDFALLNSMDFDTLEVAGTGVCTNGGTLVANGIDAIYTSPPGYTGTDTCTYNIMDGRGGLSGNATVFLNVSSGGVPPTAVDDGPGNTPGGPYVTNQGQPVSVDVLVNDLDADGDPIRVSRVDAATASGGSVVIINGGVEGGDNLTYTPASGFNGTDNFTYDVTDDVDGTSSANVRITVSPFTESSAGTVVLSERVSAAAIGVEDPVTNSSCVGGCTHYQITGVPAGGQVQVLLPKLNADIPNNPVLRHFVESTNEWKAHDAPDGVQSAPADAVTGLCPGLVSALWGAVTPGQRCVRLTMTDDDGTGNGPNDDDPTATIILDPVGFGEQQGGAVNQDSVSSSGCSVTGAQHNDRWSIGHWLIVGLFLTGVWLRKKSNNHN